MQLSAIYRCLGDETRLRILHLLTVRPLCVCHLQSLLGLTQVQASKHLACLRRQKMVEAQRHRNWMIYRLPKKPDRALRKNLQCLRDCAAIEPALKADRRKLEKISHDLRWLSACRPLSSPATRP